MNFEQRRFTMEEFVRKVLSRYTSFVSEKQLYERWLDMRENSDVRDALVMTDMKITMIQSWFNLLNADERFVIEKHLLDELEWPRVAFSFTNTILFLNIFKKAEERVIMKTVMRNETFSNNRSGI